MLKTLNSLRDFEKDLVNGYYRLNSNEYDIPNVVMNISMTYLWILDEFMLPQHKNNNNNKDIDNEDVECDDISICGLNRTVIKCMFGGMTASIFGKNIITSIYGKYHHWRFKIIKQGINKSDDDDDDNNNDNDEYDFIVGIKRTDRNNGYSFIGSHGLKLHGLSKTYSNKRFNKKNDILDMYLDLDRGELSYNLNNNSLGIAYNKLDITKSYKMQCALTNKQSTLELVSYHYSSSSSSSSSNKHNLFEYINYIRSISLVSFIDSKIKHFEDILNKYGINMMKGEILNDYIDCLVVKEDYNKIYSFLEQYNFQIDDILICNLCKMASYFYFEQNDFCRALNIFKLIKNDNDLIDNHLIVEIAFCYEQTKENWFEAIKYYELSIKYESKLQESGRNECLHHEGAIYFNYIYDYKSALNCFLRMSSSEIHQRDLESAIASCYDQLKDYPSSLKYFKKYQLKYKDKPSVIIAIALIYFKCNNYKKADKYFHRALELDKDKTNWMIHSKYGYYLLNGKCDYKMALKYFLRALSISSNKHEIGESYKCIGATYDKLGDMINAIKYTQKVLDINPNDADALNNAGYFFLTMKKYEIAHKNLVKSLEIYPDGELTTGNIGICLYEMGKYNESIPYLKRAIYELPADIEHSDVGPRCLECYAIILFKEKNDYKNSIKILKMLTEHKQFHKNYNKNKDEIYYLMSRIYSKLTDFENSLKCLKKAKKFNPNRQIYENQIKILKNTMVPDLS